VVYRFIFSWSNRSIICFLLGPGPSLCGQTLAVCSGETAPGIICQSSSESQLDTYLINQFIRYFIYHFITESVTHLFMVVKCLQSRNSPAGVVARILARKPKYRVRFQAAAIYFPLSSASIPVLEPNLPTVQLVPGALSTMAKRPEPQAYHSFPSGVEVKNSGAILPLPHTSSWHSA
jgi:hypothetical protein